jgi:hypothetical protein
MNYQRTSIKRWRLVIGVATLLVLASTATDPATGEAAAPARPFATNGEGSDSKPGGQGAEEGGPRRGTVDERFSTPAKARGTVRAKHQHAHGDHAAGEDAGADAGSSTSRAEGPNAAALNEGTLDPAVFGSWQRTSYNLPMRAIHATLLRTGKVLLLAGSGNQSSAFQAGSFKAGLLDPATGAYKAINVPYDMFCAGHAQLPNGNILIVGGTLAYPTGNADWKGSKRNYEFDVTAERWIARPSLAHGRWYPSSVQAPSGHVWNFAGQNEYGKRNTQVERYTASTNTVVQKPAWNLPKYPGLLWTAKDRVFYAGTRSGGAAEQPGLYNPGTGAVQAVNGITALDQRRAAATLFAGDATTQRVIVVGGGWPATKTTSYIDLRPTTPKGVAGPNLSTAKAYVGAVNLPTDGSVFQTGGGTGRDTPVYESSIIRGNTVVPMAPNTVARTYHSSTLLLPDGRVLTMGGDDYGDGFEMQVEVFTPPYLHNGTRPVITAAPATMAYGSTHTVSATANDASLASAWLIRPSSTTHSVDPNQRAVRLNTTAVAGGLRFTTPSKYLVQPGYYMVFVNDSKGRPSVARWVKIG